ncbi:hypothetical protein [Roseiconus lacunae]|uniref:Uncharacterized protein n=1 Tax=Roseiconus lacunae TaxID=2605694 RepID=A0ABT7PIH1_9BACT|nr:hypothetical protein [Roseiconus lacunae]MCD0461306.1 hypothetical protein [Roseiconus lacunae]MDM4016133.1 hypothetical protein [Roseiconus lacunae]WRQ51533.1 hypothetical protein U8335_03110 [Stieleria sp. HD01]
MKITSPDSIRRLAFAAVAAACMTGVSVAQYPNTDSYGEDENAPRLFESSLFADEPVEDEFSVFEMELNSTTNANPRASLSEHHSASEPVAAIAQTQPLIEAPEPTVQKPQAEPVGVLVDEVSSSSDRSIDKPTVMELRQARAQLREKARLERMERNLWYGYEPLRPNWNAVPMTHSRYNHRTTYLVPVYFGR